MKRSPLQRKTWMHRAVRKSKYARRARDTAYMLWVKTLPCSLIEVGYCSGEIHAHHAGRRAFGKKAADTTCIALCAHHHRSLHERLGFFHGRTKQWVREWQEFVVAMTQLNWQRYSGCDELAERAGV